MRIFTETAWGWAMGTLLALICFIIIFNAGRAVALHSDACRLGAVSWAK